jgi:hypothetical protein
MIRKPGIFFASGRGFPLPAIVNMGANNYHKIGVDTEDVMAGALEIKKRYDMGANVMSMAECEDIFLNAGESIHRFKVLNPNGWPINFEIYFWWHVHEALWRQVIVRRLRLAGNEVHVAGGGWFDNDEFKDIASPHIMHGKDLAEAYASHSMALHIGGPAHHRMAEILLSGGTVALPDVDGVTLATTSITLQAAKDILLEQRRNLTLIMEKTR